MLRFIERINHRNAVMENLNALLLMYPRKRQFIRDFPKLKATLREHFEGEVAPPSSALAIAISIIEGFLQQLSAEEKRATAAALAASDLTEIEKLAERRIGGEKDQPGDKVFFATRLSGVAILIVGRNFAETIGMRSALVQRSATRRLPTDSGTGYRPRPAAKRRRDQPLTVVG